MYRFVSFFQVYLKFTESYFLGLQSPLQSRYSGLLLARRGCTKKISQFHRDKEDFKMPNNSVYFTDGNANGWVHAQFLILCV